MSADYPTGHNEPQGHPENPQRPGGPYSEEVRHSRVSARVPESIGRGAFSTGAVILQGNHEFIVDFLLRLTSPHHLASRVILAPAVFRQFIQALEENIRNYEKRFGEIPKPQLKDSESSEGKSPNGEPSDSGEHQHASDHGEDDPGAQGLPAGGQPGGFQQTVGAGYGNAPQETGTDETESASGGQSQRPSAQELYDQLKFTDEMLSGRYANAVMIGHSGAEFSFDFITTFFPRSVVSSRIYMSAPHVPQLLDSLKHSFEQYQRRVAEMQKRQPPPEEDDDEPPEKPKGPPPK